MVRAKTFLRRVLGLLRGVQDGGRREPCVITRDRAKQLVESFGHEFEVMSFAELDKLARDLDDPPGVARVVEEDGASIDLWANIDTHHGRRNERRVIVEVFIHAPGMDRWWWRPCYYFERSSSGRIVKY